MMWNLGFWGNAYAEKELDKAGRVIALWPLLSKDMKIRRENGLIWYYYTLRGQEKKIFSERIFHVKGLSSDGLVGKSNVRIARESIGLTVAMEEFGARFFENGANAGGVLQHPGSISDKAFEHLQKFLKEKHGGLSKAHGTMILEEGMKFEKISIPPEDAQFLESRKFQLAEIARWYRIPLILLAEYEKAATYASVEQFAIQFVVQTIRPWLVRWEQAILNSLFFEKERKRYFAEFIVDGLLRGDIKTRYEAHATGRQWGWLSADDVRRLENMNPLPDGQGETYLVPMNMIPASSASAAPAELPQQQRSIVQTRAAESRRRIASSFTGLFADAELKIVKREAADVMKAARKYLLSRSLNDFKDWLGRFYEDHKDFMRKTWLPVYRTFAETVRGDVAAEIGIEAGLTPKDEQFISDYVDSHINYQASSSRGQIQKIVEENEEPVPEISKRLEEWKERRPNKIAQWETVQASCAIARETYRSVGIRRLQWVAFDESCPYCMALDGKIVGIDQTFLGAGIGFMPEGAKEPLTPSVNIFHPPAHGGCDCQIVAAV
jgi:HK97 family phage portal protein